MSSRRAKYEIRYDDSFHRALTLRLQALRKEKRWFRNTKLILGLGILAGAVGIGIEGNYFSALFLVGLASLLLLVPFIEKRRSVRLKKSDSRRGQTFLVWLSSKEIVWWFGGWASKGGWEKFLHAHRYDDGIALDSSGHFFWLPDDQLVDASPDRIWRLLQSKLENCIDQRGPEAQRISEEQSTQEGDVSLQVDAPNRVSRSYTQELVGTPAQVFPLLCPVREADWIEGWSPLLVVSESGVAEPDCIFVTESDRSDSIWTVTRHEPEQGFVEMLKVTPEETVCRLTIQLKSAESGSQADITYQHTSLGPAGDKLVEEFTEAYFEAFMREWEERLNHYLEHGSALVSTWCLLAGSTLLG